MRNIRIEEGLWRAAQQLAQERGESLTAVIERALRVYVADRPR